MHALEAVLEVFTWVGFGAGFLVLLIALVMRIADGTWEVAHVVLEGSPGGRVARWFSRDGVGEALLTHDQEKALAGHDAADVYTRAGVDDRIRLTRRSPAVRAVLLLGTGLVALGVVATVISLVMLFVQG